MSKLELDPDFRVLGIWDDLNYCGSYLFVCLFICNFNFNIRKDAYCGLVVMLGKPRKGKSDTNLRTQSHMRDVSRYSISIGTKLGRRLLGGTRTQALKDIANKKEVPFISKYLT